MISLFNPLRITGNDKKNGAGVAKLKKIVRNRRETGGDGSRHNWWPIDVVA